MKLVIWVVVLLFTVADTRKNVLFLVSDDMRPNIMAYEGPDYPAPSVKMHTPTLDALAKRSLLLERAYVSQAVCSPSRTALLTGRRPDTTHIYDNTHYFRVLGGNFTTLPQYFKEHGYRTVGMGKVFHPGSASGGDDPISWTDPYFRAKDYYGHEDIIKMIPDEETKTKPLPDMQLADNAIKVLKEVAPKAKSGEQPFFIAVGVHRPHLPWVFPKSFTKHYPISNIKMPENYYVPTGMPPVAWHNFTNMGKYKDVQKHHFKDLGFINFTYPRTLTKDFRQAYYSCISYIDYQLGRVIAELDNLELSNNTIITFWGDHGWQLGEHTEWEKQTNFELGAHAPMMIHIPGLTNKGIRTRNLTEFVDLYPTVVEAAGLPLLQLCPDNSTFVPACTEGMSLMPLIRNPQLKQWKTAAFSQFPRTVSENNVMGYTVRTDRYRYTEWPEFQGAPVYKPIWGMNFGRELYDHEIDPQENVNRVHDPAYEEIASHLSGVLQAGWRNALPSDNP